MQRGSVRNGERVKDHERQQMCFHKGRFKWKQCNVNIQMITSTFAWASFQFLSYFEFSDYVLKPCHGFRT